MLCMFAGGVRGNVGPKVAKIGPKLAPQQRLVHSSSKNQRNTASTQRDPAGALLNLVQNGPKLAPSWLQVGSRYTKLTHAGSMFVQVSPS